MEKLKFMNRLSRRKPKSSEIFECEFGARNTKSDSVSRPGQTFTERCRMRNCEAVETKIDERGRVTWGEIYCICIKSN